MNKTRFYFCENRKEEKGGMFILDMETGYFARIIQFRDKDEFNDYKARANFAVYVTGYMIAIRLEAVINGIWPEHPGPILSEMASFYYRHTIGPAIPRFKRYLE